MRVTTRRVLCGWRVTECVLTFRKGREGSALEGGAESDRRCTIDGGCAAATQKLLGGRRAVGRELPLYNGGTEATHLHDTEYSERRLSMWGVQLDLIFQPGQAPP